MWSIQWDQHAVRQSCSWKQTKTCIISSDRQQKLAKTRVQCITEIINTMFPNTRIGKRRFKWLQQDLANQSSVGCKMSYNWQEAGIISCSRTNQAKPNNWLMLMTTTLHKSINHERNIKHHEFSVLLQDSFQT